MNAAWRRELIAELHSQQQDPDRLHRYCQYALDILLDGADQQGVEDKLDPAFEGLGDDERTAYLAAQASRLGCDLLRFVQGWAYTELELVDEWRSRSSTNGAAVEL
jgi:hypothetical protein